MWCMVALVTETLAFGFTQDGEKVLMTRAGEGNKGIEGVQKGDIVTFLPRPIHPDPHPEKMGRPCDLFGAKPKILARRFVRPVSRQRPTDACAWKQQKDEQEDAEAQRAMRV